MSPLPHDVDGLFAAAELVEAVEDLRDLTRSPGYADAVHRLLAVARVQTGMRVAWLSEFVGDAQVLRFVDTEPGSAGPAAGTSLPMSGSFCARVLDGRFPSLIPETRSVPEAALLDVTAALHIGAYVGVPLVGPHGVAVGMLCAVDDRSTPSLSERDVTALRMLAQVLHDLQDRALAEGRAAAQRSALHRTLSAVVAGEGRHAVLQPVVDLTTGRAYAAEGLTRFTAASPVQPAGGPARSPAQWFDDAARLGMRDALELAAAASALDLLDGAVPPDVAVTVNLGPETLLSPGLGALLDGRPLERVVVEVTEHAPVTDYEALARALDPYRADGLRLAVDDAGAGYSSLRHVLAVRPDLVKVDMALVRGADDDLARRTLLLALSRFADATGCRLVTEGVETPAELRAVYDCGVRLAQGYLLGRPSPAPAWDGYPTP